MLKWVKRDDHSSLLLPAKRQRSFSNADLSVGLLTFHLQILCLKNSLIFNVFFYMVLTCEGTNVL